MNWKVNYKMDQIELNEQIIALEDWADDINMYCGEIRMISNFGKKALVKKNLSKISHLLEVMRIQLDKIKETSREGI